MDVAAYLQTGLGILVSVVLFLVGYRQTIGARKERAKAANAALVRALTRRLVLESYSPRAPDLARLIEGKALDYQVRVNDLLTVEQLLSMVYAGIFDSELIATANRTEIEVRLAAVYEDLAKSSDSAGGEAAVPRTSSSPRYATATLALTTALIGAAVVVLPELLSGDFLDPKLIRGGAAALVTSLVVIFAIEIIRRAKDSGDALITFIAETSLDSIDDRVERLLKRMKLRYERRVRLTNFQRPDFLVALGKRRLVMITRSWRLAPVRTLQEAVASASKMLEPAEAGEALIVVEDGQAIPTEVHKPNVTVVPFSQLRSELEHRATSDAA
jgi:hypothetical protein